MLQIKRLSYALATEWDAYVASKPDATCHHLSAWIMIAEREYDLRARLIVARDAPNGPLRGGLPLVSVPRPLGRYVTTGLFGAYGPILADNDAITADLLSAARQFTDEDGSRYLHVKSYGESEAPQGFSRHDVWVTAVLSLDGGAEAVWRRFKSSIRAAVRQAMRAGLELRSGFSELDTFYEILAENMHRKGAPIYGSRFMRSLLEELGPRRADIVTLWLGDVPISGAMTTAYGDVMYIPFASSRASHFHLRPNNLLYWRIMERACEANLRVLDFGTSLLGSSALAFKTGWGATTRPVPSFVYMHDAHESPALTADSAMAQTGVALLKRLPRPIADALGPRICRMIV